PGRSWPSFLAVAFLVLLTGAVIANLAAGRAVPCPCFDPRSRRPVSAATVARNGVLIALGILGTGSTAGADLLATLVLSAVTVTVTQVGLRRFG
ncbi:MAG TPA: MauE/DoxX family redox-associated membrane protein, partial [Acidimicrobiia bacterium]|nr:MauE/DoxX family redox-associated membrane protein [Acidimicrobiia bacterium]